MEDSQLIAKAREVGVIYEFAEPGLMETQDDRRKRHQQNQRRVPNEEKRLREVVDLPPAVPAGSSDLEDNAYCVIRLFEVEQMTYKFSCCEVCKE